MTQSLKSIDMELTLKLPMLIQELSNEGLTDEEALIISTELMQIEALKNKLNLNHLNTDAISNVLDSVQNPSDTEKEIFNTLVPLSKRELQCFSMSVVGSMSFRGIAKALGISKGSVQQYIERARKKIYGQ